MSECKQLVEMLSSPITDAGDDSKERRYARRSRRKVGVSTCHVMSMISFIKKFK